ncbi:hypothetical protein M419DRAFT_6893 [Trichoderma reesei RUT C-30]|uniref:Uncharacterized protein n=1 Tax=Hypocrea jecorina (strain ATCC 56765 / BCRC 32924 / NRRL 11460 / Rut C-30) TaxID=1344414 RepID=A0A024SHY4_HYPJR|nr:hypothetical protein M419DRAFT_6893 [Trichoderma reesei RUT C-30]
MPSKDAYATSPTFNAIELLPDLILLSRVPYSPEGISNDWAPQPELGNQRDDGDGVRQTRATESGAQESIQAASR